MATIIEDLDIVSSTPLTSQGFIVLSKNVASVIIILALPVWDSWMRESQLKIENLTTGLNHEELDTNTWWMFAQDTIYHLRYAAIPCGIIFLLLIRGQIAKHYRHILCAGLVLLANIISWKMFMYLITSDDTKLMQREVTISIIKEISAHGPTTMTMMHKLVESFFPKDTTQYLAAELFLLVMVWFLLDMETHMVNFVIVILLMFAPIVIFYIMWHMIWLLGIILIITCCFTVGVLLLRYFQIQLCISWCILFVMRLIIIKLRGPTDMWDLMLVQTFVETCYTVLGRVYFCSTVGYISQGLWFIIFRIYLHYDVTAMIDQGSKGFILFDYIISEWFIGLPFSRYISSEHYITLVYISVCMSLFNKPISSATVALAVSRSGTCLDHIRILALNLFFMFLPIYAIYYTQMSYGTPPWIYIVTQVYFLNAFHVYGMFQSYLIICFDNLIRRTPWKDVDDALKLSFFFVMCLQCISLVYFLTCAGWIIRYEFEWQILCCFVAAIYDLGLRILVAIATYRTWKEAKKLLANIPDASKQRLEHCEDKCSICLEPMRSAKLTQCGHLFHGQCLSKWLYVKRSCPMCRQDFETVAHSSI